MIKLKGKRDLYFSSQLGGRRKIPSVSSNHNYPSGDSLKSLNRIIMESANLYQHHQLQPQLVYSSLPSSTAPEWNPSIILDGDEFHRYMNEILPTSREFWPKNSNLVPSVRSTALQDIKFCDSRSYEHPSFNKLQSENVKGSISDCFLKLTGMNHSAMNSSYMKSEQQDVNVIDLNQNIWPSPFADSHSKQKFSAMESYPSSETFARFAGLADPASSTYADYNNFYASNSLLTSSTNLLLARDMLNYRNSVEAPTQSVEERISLGYCQPQQSSESPSKSSGKTSNFRNEVSKTSMVKSPAVCLTEAMHLPSRKVVKRPRVVSQSSRPTLKVRKEKLGDRIAAMHRLVSPFGKTDTASVLTEAIGYIQFLQDQIQALSMSYAKSSLSKSSRTTRGDLAMKDQRAEDEPTQDLRSRGLCLVPLAFTSSYVCSYNGSI